MYVRRIHYPLTTLGPGNRIGIYVMGCNKRCKGCMAKELQTVDEKYSVDVKDIISVIKNYYLNDNSIGVTISGGEPFLQSDLDELVEGIRKIGIMDIMVYSGYTYDQLIEMGKSNILKNIGVLVDGEYIEELNDNKALRGSSNQKVIFLNDSLKDKYKECINSKRKIEYVINDNKIDVYGIFDKNMEKKLKDTFNKYNMEFISGNE